MPKLIMQEHASDKHPWMREVMQLVRRNGEPVAKDEITLRCSVVIGNTHANPKQIDQDINTYINDNESIDCITITEFPDNIVPNRF